MKKLLLLNIILIGCSIISCTDNTADELMMEGTIKTKSETTFSDTTKIDSSKTGVNVDVSEWNDTVSSKHEF
ncbi:MAG: hypothetical protein H6Q12_1104 [Bacteroidetes bacterium]|nr:hypothetical protein [Bacteroidota bacterium]